MALDVDGELMQTGDERGRGFLLGHPEGIGHAVLVFYVCFYFCFTEEVTC